MAELTNSTLSGAAALSGLARALVQNGKLRLDQADTLAKAAAAANTSFIDQLLGGARRELFEDRA